ncbi:MAG: uracil-DNA glycosylase family protein [Bacteroidota bacterium]
MKLFDENIFSVDAFYAAFSELLKTSKKDWINAISVFKKEFENNVQDEKIIHFNKTDLKIDNSENFYLSGFDMPCWVSNEDSKKKIMILASEPLRDEISFDKSKLDKFTNISLNTPFSYHTSGRIKNPKFKDRRQYWSLIDWMVTDLKSTVYMTDIRKFWFADWQHHKEFGDTKLHLDIFKKELELVKPDFIILFGSTPMNILQSANLLESEIHLTKYKLKEEGFKLKWDNHKESEWPVIIPLIHPSGAAGGPRKHFFTVNDIYKEGLDQNEMYKLIIEKYIKN